MAAGAAKTDMALSAKSTEPGAAAPRCCIADATEKEKAMPAKSQAQQKAAGAALSAKRGDSKVSELRGASKSMYESMSEKELEELASAGRKDKPEHIK